MGRLIGHRGGLRPFWLPCIVTIACLPGGPSAPLSPTPVYAFPSPGDQFASPQTQIAFRGLNVMQLGSILVTGSLTGAHTGRLLGDSDNDGGSFIPSVAFRPGENVTVSTHLNVVGSDDGTFTFAVARPGRQPTPGPYTALHRAPGDETHFRSRPDLVPPAVSVTKDSPQLSPGDIFLGPQAPPLQAGPMILGAHGRLIWFKPLSGGQFATDVSVQQYRGKPVLTWWQGQMSAPGYGAGEDVVYDSSYRQIAVVRAANGLQADQHAFQITPQDTALITAYFPVHADASSVQGSSNEVVEDSVVQEIDIPTGLVLFQWDSLDHVPLVGTYAPRGNPFDYFHVNAVDQDSDGNFVISSRYMWAAYKVDRHTAATIWVLGGRHSSIGLGAGASFAFQHDVHVQSGGDRLVTVFDNGEIAPSTRVHPQSRGLVLRLDLAHATATRVRQFDHSPALMSGYEGSVEPLSNGDTFIGWGAQPYFSEYDARGRQIFDARFVATDPTYTAWRSSWHASPITSPAVTVHRSGRRSTVYVSWNGATDVKYWLLLGASSSKPLKAVVTARARGFETAISAPAERWFEVKALNASHRVIGESVKVAG